MRAAVAIAFVLFYGGALAQSQSPTPQVHSTADSEQQPTVAVTVVEPPPTPEELKRDEQRRQEDLAIQTAQVTFNGRLVWITGFQAVISVLALAVSWMALSIALAQKRNMDRQTESMSGQLAATKKAADAAMLTAVIENRGYLSIGGWGSPQLSDHQANFFYALSNNGKTPVTIERGEIRFSIDKPIQLRDRYDIPTQIIGAHEKVAEGQRPVATFGPISHQDARQGVHRMPDTTVLYLSGDIYYRDAFPGTPLHRKRFGVKHIATGWYQNDAVPNDEIDEV